MKRSRLPEPALVAALAAGQTIKAAAEAAGISERTARRRMKEPEVREAVAVARDELLNRAVDDLAEGVSEAATVLRHLLRSESETVRLSAARAILSSEVLVEANRKGGLQ